MPMQLDPSIILNYEHDRNVTANRELAQRQRESEARIAVDQQEAELRRQEILARRDEIIQKALERNQPKEWDPNKANQALTYQQNVAKAVYGQLKQVEANPDTWVIARRNIGNLLGPDALTDLPEDVNEAMPSIKMHIASYPAEAEKAQLQLVTHYDPATQTNVLEFVTPTVGKTYPQAAPKPAVEGTGSDYKQFLERYAKARNKAVADLTDVEELDAKKRWGQADDVARAAAPGLGPSVVIKPNTREFRIAQDIAYGKLTLADFRSMLGRAASNADLKLGIYDKARELNPDFNPAQFEMGFRLASNPKVQQQLASVDNVIMGVPDLLKFSEAATRTRSPFINSFVIPGGVMLGGKKYSNFGGAALAFADELSGALGYGSATDMSREMGISLTDKTLSPAAFASAMQDVVIPFVNRKRASLLKQMGVYGQPGMNPAGDAAAAATAPKMRFNPATGKVEAIK